MKKQKKSKDTKTILYLILRYLIILIVASSNLAFFYFILTPLTVYFSFFILNLFYSTSINGTTLLVKGVKIVLVNACIAGSAYFLLFTLNLSTPINLKKMAYSLLFSMALFLVINVIRIIGFSLLYLNSFKYFNFTHLLFWYALSVIIVLLVWFTTVKIFSIKNYPIYSDIIYIVSFIKFKK